MIRGHNRWSKNILNRWSKNILNRATLVQIGIRSLSKKSFEDNFIINMIKKDYFLTSDSGGVGKWLILFSLMYRFAEF